MEQCQVAYLRAVCAQACCDMSKSDMDIHKIDWSIQHEDAHMPIGVQLKSVRVAPNELPRVQIDDATHKVLRRTDAFRRFLFVLSLPDDGQWVQYTPEALHVRTQMFWLNLRGEDPLKTATKTYPVIKDQVVTSEWLCGIFRDIDQEFGEE
jgi:hypothetical protein